MNESPWFKDYKSSGHVLKAYKCQDAKIVRAETAKCEARVNSFGMADLRRDFERVLLSTPPKFNPTSENLKVIDALTRELLHLNKSDPCYEYILAMGEMLAGTFKMMRLKHWPELPNQLVELYKPYFSYLSRILRFPPAQKSPLYLSLSKPINSLGGRFTSMVVHAVEPTCKKL